MIGTLLSGRYLIEAVVGTGGMAVVYRAHDRQTDRTVAIKVLRKEYESDIEFVHRFSVEAEAAAKMSHENIVNLLNVGIDGDMRYIVMEYIDGCTLKEMIHKKKRINPGDALRMTLRILAAVDHAHRNGIVHRDIKPQNILVDKKGAIKVADFGIARLKTAQAELDNAQAMGSVHYISPEQALGEVADVQSDLYSVGIVLYEMLTGRVPFDGDTPSEVAQKHVEERAEHVRAHNPKVSVALDEVIMRALCKEKERRYQSAAEMAGDLRTTLLRPEGGFVRYPSNKSEVSAQEETKSVPAKKPAKRTENKKSERGKGYGRVILIAAATVCALAVAALLIINRLDYRRMPQMLGMEQQPAENALTSLGLVPSVVTAYSEEYADGQVMLQSKPEGDYVQRGTQITLTISMGSQWYELEDMVGWDVEQAEQALEDARVREVNINYIMSDEPVGQVVAVDAQSGTMSRDKAINLYVSGKRVSVPQLSGLTLEGAEALLRAEGLTVGEITEGSSKDVDAGTVIDQSIAPYTQVLTDTAVDITVCGARYDDYAPSRPIMLVVPLENIRVTVQLTTPSGTVIKALDRRFAKGTHYVELDSVESGLHTAEIYMDDVLMETLELYFE